MSSRLCFLAVLTFALAGCKGAAPASAEADAGKSPAAAPDRGASSGEPGGALSLADLPEELRNDAFEYYGLSSGEPQKVEVSSSMRPEPEIGAQTFKLREVKDGRALFEVERTGALADQQNGELELREDGLYTVKLYGSAIDPPQMEIPSDFRPGKSWTSKGAITLPNGQKTELNNTWKVVGEEKLKTKAGEFAAMRIDGGGSMTTAGQKLKVAFKGWFVKGVGAVRIELKTTAPDGKTESVKIEAVK